MITSSSGTNKAIDDYYWFPVQTTDGNENVGGVVSQWGTRKPSLNSLLLEYRLILVLVSDVFRTEEGVDAEDISRPLF